MNVSPFKAKELCRWDSLKECELGRSFWIICTGPVAVSKVLESGKEKQKRARRKEVMGENTMQRFSLLWMILKMKEGSPKPKNAYAEATGK